MDILNVEHVSQSFGNTKVLDDVSFAVPENSVFGFLGQNGAGKTTTMKIILGLMKPTGGNVSILGETVTYGQTKTNRFVGYLPDVPEYYTFMTPKEYLKLCAQITNMPSNTIKKSVDEMLELVGLANANKKIGGFSRGMKQRLGIAQALLNQPKLLICDEPTSALDPLGRKEILDILHQVKGKTTVVFSTHILSDVEKICDNIAVIHNGKIALSGSIQDIKNRERKETLLIEFKSEKTLKTFMNLSEYGKIENHAEKTENGILINSTDIDGMFSYIMNVMSAHKIIPSKLEILEPTLEDVFMEVIG
ncbi:ABC transporter ATP-binding protein [Anaerosporobacter sp.]|uniref:ABC transporter ATP-binding protein n=1 Tax=Anaerosporobacter sp. TaxID=1872529 RepID=UPI00286F4CA4|nr:ABC transporter ATP-binding protein [Anaerosporobacter sp.]